MRVVLQRVLEASVTVGGKVVGEIGPGHLLLVGFTDEDGLEGVAWMAEKVVGLRIFNDEEGKMNLGLGDVGGDLLVVSQFTLYGDARKGRRPSFVHAARLLEGVLRTLRDGRRTVVLVTHALSEGLALADHVLLLVRGQVALDVPAGALDEASFAERYHGIVDTAEKARGGIA